MRSESNRRLDEFTKDEWYDVMRKVDPNMTRAEYEKEWEHFMEYKAMLQGVAPGVH